ncbi:hypothetical protein EYC80_003082 [Monilinia laxa]|uniref:Uncharacterized protein n=1 Tax=Monilinia laxa TaxID=61186 RepID=A0A5N6KCQ0_MONLA|nr:hypothetical protein EYC80_003082 [Monilinia laxa]
MPAQVYTDLDSHDSTTTPLDVIQAIKTMSCEVIGTDCFCKYKLTLYSIYYELDQHTFIYFWWLLLVLTWSVKVAETPGFEVQYFLFGSLKQHHRIL